MRNSTAAGYAERVREIPRVAALLSSWEPLEAAPFFGVTADGDRTPDLFSLRDEGVDPSGPRRAAERFLETLTESQRASTSHDVNSRVWRLWLNPEIYLNEVGTRLDEATAETRGAAIDLLRVSLSREGFDAARRVMRINAYLGGLVGGERVMNEFSYNVNIFGDPRSSEPWGWQFFGHHLALNCIYVDRQLVMTPVFMGSEPTYLPGEDAATALFTAHEVAGLALLDSLDASQRQRSVLFDRKRDERMPPGRLAHGDELNVAGAFQDNRVIPYEGIALSECDAEQRALAMTIFEEFLFYQPEPARRSRLGEARRHLDDTSFCWIGGTSSTDPFYFRLQGPTLLVELDHHAGVFLSNDEPARFHTHTTVRTPNGNDYGVALTEAASGIWRELLD